MALSFPGEHRRFVRGVAKRLAEALRKDRVFFDEWYEAELRGANADLKLKRIYREEADLVVPFFSEYYEKQWCQIEWHSIRVVLAERRMDDAVIPVHLDGTRVEGWESIDLGIRKGRKTASQIADAILDIYRQRHPADETQYDVTRSAASREKATLKLVSSSDAPSRRSPLVLHLNRSIAQGELRDSSIAPTVLTALRKSPGITLANDFDPRWTTTGIRLSDEYFVRIRPSAAQRDWQKDIAQVATPTLVGLVRSLERSPESQALVIRLCNLLAKRLRLRLIWPQDVDELNDVVNALLCSVSRCHGTGEP